MTEFNMTVPSGTKRVLHTAGQYFDRDIVIEVQDSDYDEGYGAAQAAAEARNSAILEDCNAVFPTKGVETAETLEQVPVRIGEIVQEEDYFHLCNKPNIPGLGVFDKEEVVLNFDYAYYASQLTYVDWGAVGYDNRTVKHLTVNFAQKLLQGDQMFAYTNNMDYILERITLNADLSQIPRARQMFSHSPALKVVDGTPLDLSSATLIGTFANYCDNLEEIRFVPNTIKVTINFAANKSLSNATIQSIIDGLAEVETLQTLTLHADVGAKLTDEQKAVITAKNWTLVY